jgi:hypothetical protein
MKVELLNNGPVTLIVESPEKKIWASPWGEAGAVGAWWGGIAINNTSSVG